MYGAVKYLRNLGGLTLETTSDAEGRRYAIVEEESMKGHNLDENLRDQLADWLKHGGKKGGKYNGVYFTLGKLLMFLLSEGPKRLK